MRTKNQFHFLCLFLFIASCRQEKEDANVVSNFHQLKTIETDGYLVPKESIQKPKIIPAGEPLLIPSVKPGALKMSSNIFPVPEKPTRYKADSALEIITPGINSIPMPTITNSIEVRVQPGQPEVVPAKDKGSHEQNPENFSYLGKIQGLKQEAAFCFLQDKRGNLWFGTYLGGAVCYDGKSFTYFTRETGLRGDYIKTIFEDSSGNIWFGASGVTRYDGKFFTNFTGKTGFTNSTVTGMVQDTSGHLWFATYNDGVFCYDGKSFTHFKKENGLPDNHVVSVCADKKGVIWFGTVHGVCNYNGKSFTRFNNIGGLGNYEVWKIIEDHNGNMWMTSFGDGIYRYDEKYFTHFSLKAVSANDAVTSVIEDKNGYLWIGTGLGLVRKDEKYFTVFTEKDGLTDNAILSVYEDKKGNLWVGADVGGVNLYRGNLFAHLSVEDGLSSNNIFSILKDKDGNMWFGSAGGGLMKYIPAKDGKPPFITNYDASNGLINQYVRSVIQDKKGNIWIGTDAGLFVYDKNSFKQYTHNEGLPGDFVHNLMEDHLGNIWVGTDRGACCFDGKSFTVFTDKQGLPDKDTWCICEDHFGNVWFGTAGGACRFDGKTFTRFTEKDGLSNDKVTSMLNDKKNRTWFATLSGLFRYDGKKMTKFTEKEGLANNMIQALAEDQKGDIWIGTRNGISKYVNKDTAATYEKQSNSFAKNSHQWFKNYTYADGFSGIGTNENAICALNDGTIWFGSDDRLTIYHPEGDYIDTIPPCIQISSVKLFNEDVPWGAFDKSSDTVITLANGVEIKNLAYQGISNWYHLPQHLHLSYKNNYLNFTFIGITTQRSEQVKYEFFLEGLEKSWGPATTKTEANYGNLPPASYTFKVKAMNSEGYWSDEFQYTFTIRSPWWETWWFRTLAIVVVIASIYAYFRYRTTALRRRQKQLQRTVEKRTEQLREALNEKESLLKEIHHRVKNNLEVISSLLMLQTEGIKNAAAKAALAEGQSRVQSIALIHHKLYRNEEIASVEFFGFVNDLYKQVNELFRKSGSEIEFRLDAEETQIDVDAAVPLGLILNELLTNSFKYAVQPGKKNRISIQLTEDNGAEPAIQMKTGKNGYSTTNYKLFYRDNGPGMPMNFNFEKSVSLGMKVIQLLTKQLGGKLNFYNDNGSVFEIPFKTKFLA